MTEPDADTAHYIGILEAVVAVLAIKVGISPQAMMSRAIQDITKQAGMETVDTDALIQGRWVNRDIRAETLAATVDILTPQATGVRLVDSAPTPQPDMAARVARYKAQKTSEDILNGSTHVKDLLAQQDTEAKPTDSES